MSRRHVALATSALLVLASGCRRAVPGDGRASGAAAALSMIESGRFDEAIDRLRDAGDAESLYLLGRAWSGKARTAPVPTPAAGVPTEAQSFKPEELRALDFFERAVAAKPDHAAAQLALAELLAPQALARVQAGGKGDKLPPTTAGPDVSPARVLRAFGAAMQADPSGTAAADGLARFATAAGRLSEADAAYRELVQRRPEDPQLLVRYGDFLAGPKADPEAALAPYGQALMWRTDDGATRRKIAEIHLRAVEESLKRQEYAAAEARLAEVRRAAVDPSSPQAARAKELEQALREIRSR